MRGWGLGYEVQEENDDSHDDNDDDNDDHDDGDNNSDEDDGDHGDYADQVDDHHEDHDNHEDHLFPISFVCYESWVFWYLSLDVPHNSTSISNHGSVVLETNQHQSFSARCPTLCIARTVRCWRVQRFQTCFLVERVNRVNQTSDIRTLLAYPHHPHNAPLANDWLRMTNSCSDHAQITTASTHIKFKLSYLTTNHLAWPHLKSHHLTTNHITSPHNQPHHITSHHITSHHITSRHVTSHHITPHHTTPHHTTPHHITSPPTRHHQNTTARRNSCRLVRRENSVWAADWWPCLHSIRKLVLFPWNFRARLARELLIKHKHHLNSSHS